MDIESRCQAVVEPMLSFFALEHGKVSVQTSFSFSLVIREVFHRAAIAFNIINKDTLFDDFDDNVLINALFPVDADFDLASGERKARLLAQGIAGVLNIVCQLADTYITPAMLHYRCEKYATGEQRNHVITLLGNSKLFTDCTFKVQLEDLIVEASGLVESTEAAPDASATSPTDEFSGVNTDGCDWARPDHKMGLPWGFTVMSLK